MSSTEKLKASENATICHMDWYCTNETMIMTRQKRLVITVNAFFSERYFFIKFFG